MAAGFSSRERDLSRLLTSIFDRLRRLERPTQIRIGTGGGDLGGTSWTLTVRSDGRLVAINDKGVVRTIAEP